MIPETVTPPNRKQTRQSSYLVLLQNSRPQNDGDFFGNSLIRRFALQATARELLPNMRVANCLRLPVPHATEIDIISNGQRANFTNLIICASVWACPVCATRISEQRREELKTALSAWLAQKRKFVFMATFTFSHQMNTPLSETLEILKEAKRKMKSGRTWQNFAKSFGIVGTITANEVTFGKSGFHPHQHELLFVDIQKGQDKKTLVHELQYLLNGYWLHALEKMGASGISGIACDVVSSNKEIARYVAKFGHDEAEVETWSLSQEMTKTVVKRGKRKNQFTMTELLELAFLGVNEAGEIWREYAEVFKGRQQLIWSRGLKELLNVTPATDTELASSEPDDMRILGSISLWDWREIVKGGDKRGKRGEILEVAKQGKEALKAYLAREFKIELITYD